MPLVKEVCVRCVNSGSAIQWNLSDERRWKCGTIICMATRTLRRQNDGVPPECYLILEQVVLIQEQEKP